MYQAALAAGSGGIRWNSATNWIELADENKNWIGWKIYNPNLQVVPITAVQGKSDATINCNYTGLYIGCCGAYGQSPNTMQIIFSGTHEGVMLHSAVNNNGKVAFIYANEGDSIRFVVPPASHTCAFGLMYIQGYTNVNKGSVNITNISESGAASLTYTAGGANCIFGFGGSTVKPVINGSIEEGTSNTVTSGNLLSTMFVGINTSKAIGSVTCIGNGGGLGGILGYCILEN